MDCLFGLYLMAILVICWTQFDSVTSSMVCAFSKPELERGVKPVTTSLTDGIEELIDSNKTTETCPTGHNFCYTLWQYNPIDPTNASLFTVLAKGCWDTSTDLECRSEECVSYSKPVKALNNTNFCCCSGHLCNAYISSANSLNDFSSYSESTNVFEKLKRFEKQMERPKNSVLIACMAGLLSIAFILLGFVFCFRAFSSSVLDTNTKHKNSDSLHLLESNSSSSQSSSLLCDLENLKLIEEIGRGRYGSVWKASLNEQTVAVKKFCAQNRQYFLNERDIYLLSFMEYNNCLPRFFGFQEIMATEGRPEYHLVLSYAPLGCLQDYLRNQTIDWLTFCKMIRTTAQGLAYLHSEVKKGEKCKPCVAHRDLSSRNILVNADNNCMICDFQFAIRTSGSEYYSCGERFDSQTASLQDVGTLRYMAPEILEGAVNLRDCESAMKQIDVYALGLVLWEMASRCTELYQGIEVPPYKQPFEHEIGLRPTFEQMQVMVTRHKARPLFPDIWKDTNPAIRALKETIEDCWDHDAEARLTALCVEERLIELPLLWERYKNGTLTNCVGTKYSMTTHSQNITNINNQKNIFRMNSENNSYHNVTTVPLDPNEKLTNEFQNNRFVNRLQYPNNNFINNNTNNLNDGSFVTFCPSNDFEKNIVSAANAFVNQPKLTLPLQPHQGRNPCLERNLMLESLDDNPSVLLEHGFKFQTNGSNQNSLFAEVFNESNNNNENNGLVANDLLNRTTNDNSRNVSRRAVNGVPPIPYVQNAVGINTIPKQPNVAGNGQSVKSINETLNAQNSSNKSGFSKLFKWTPFRGIRNLTNGKAFRQKNANDLVSVDEREPFTQNNETKNDLQNIRSVSNSLISRSPERLESPELSASTQPKVTQIDLVNGSPLINIINTNDKSNNKLISNQFNALIEHSLKTNDSSESATNLDKNKSLENVNTSPTTNQSFNRLETNLKETSVTCDSS